MKPAGWMADDMTMVASAPPTILLRQGQPADLPAMLRLEAQFPGDRLSRRQLRFHVLQADARIRVAQAQESLLGYSLLLRRARSSSARLYSLVVDTGQRGRGIGRQLLHAAEQQAKRTGARSLRLEVRADNAAALALYSAAGYRGAGMRRRYYEDGMDAVRLEKLL